MIDERASRIVPKPGLIVKFPAAVNLSTTLIQSPPHDFTQSIKTARSLQRGRTLAGGASEALVWVWTSGAPWHVDDTAVGATCHGWFLTILNNGSTVRTRNRRSETEDKFQPVTGDVFVIDAAAQHKIACPCKESELYCLARFTRVPLSLQEFIDSLPRRMYNHSAARHFAAGV